MPILEVMLDDDIKAAADYLEYMAKFIVPPHSEEVAKSTNTILAKAISLGKDKMVESLDEQQQQQKLKDVALVPVEDQIQIPMSNLRVDMEKIQPNVMLDDDIKAAANYLEYLAKSTVPPHSEEVAKSTNTILAKAISLGKGSGKGSCVTPEVPDMYTLKCINKGAGRTSKVPDESSDASSSLSSNSEITFEDISSDDDEVTEKPDEVTKKPDEITKNTNEVTEKDDEVTVKPGVVTKNADYVKMADEV
nr:hypothetical protein [Tanacetum cinerariifolium]